MSAVEMYSNDPTYRFLHNRMANLFAGLIVDDMRKLADDKSARSGSCRSPPSGARGWTLPMIAPCCSAMSSHGASSQGLRARAHQERGLHVPPVRVSGSAWRGSSRALKLPSHVVPI